jgi:hypothetical protein
MKPKSTRDRAIAAADRFVERHHGKPVVIKGKRYLTPASMTAKVAFASGWLAGFAAARRRK